MDLMRSSVFICVLLFVPYVRSVILCETGFCRTFENAGGCLTQTSPNCRINNATHTGMWLPSPTICNCCDFCMPLFGADEPCSLGGPGNGITVGRCGDGLTCTRDSDGHSYCRRMKTVCHDDQDDYDRRHASGETGAVEQRPVCGGKGEYGPFDCVPAHTCFCQSDDGERLFGEVLNLGTITTQNMHCGCSRLHHKIRKTITPGVPFPVIGQRCTSDGNFNPVQCIDRICHCVDRVTGARVGNHFVDLDDTPIRNLTCYNPALDLFPEQSVGESNFNYTTPCFEGMRERIEVLQQSQEDGFNVDFFSTVPECMPDGTYGRIMWTRNGTKICVDQWGEQIEDYEATPNTPEYDSMDCKCAQTSLLMSSSIERPVCCQNGNFRRIQCRRGTCRCVDADGRQDGREAADVTTLHCYVCRPMWHRLPATPTGARETELVCSNGYRYCDKIGLPTAHSSLLSLSPMTENRDTLYDFF